MTEPRVLVSVRAFPIGLRVSLSERGQRSVTRHHARIGTVVGHARDKTGCVILWDGYAARQTWDVEYLRPAAPAKEGRMGEGTERNGSR